jgi:tetratricopeptide (TPR) repeat protein
MSRKYYWLFVITLLWVSCSKKETTTSPGDTVTTVLSKADSNLLIAQQNFLKDSSEENYIWLGRRLAYLNRYDEAFEVYRKGLKRFPTSFRIYRHRGHRYISTRKFDAAIADLTKAVELMTGKPIEIEPDGIPNKLNVPLSTTQFNVWYHLGLAYYLSGDFQNALKAYESCMKVSNNDDLRVATSDWYFMTLLRVGDKAAANDLIKGIPEALNIIENDSYFKRLKMYQGKLSPDALFNENPSDKNYDLNLATQGYGVGNWYLANGDTARAIQVFKKVVAGKSKSAFGFIAAETDLARLNQ